MSSEDVNHYLWIMLKKSLLVVVSILMNSEDADSAWETSTSSNQYFFSLNSEFSIAWWVESRTRILIRLEIDIKSSHKIDIKYSSWVTTLILSTRASQKVDMKTWLDDQSSKDFIQVNHFQMIIFVLFIKKLEEELYFCMNYQNLNAITIKNQYSLSLISETLNHLSQAKIFIKLNIISAFNQLWIKEENEAFIIFCIQFELFKYLVMFFNLCNESISFQKYINNILHEHLNKFCTAYLNDILIYFNNKLKHEIHVKLILWKLQEANLQMNIIKCKFYITQVLYLELIIIIKRSRWIFLK